MKHDFLVRSAVAEMQRQNMTAIKADHYPGYEQPASIGKFTPDVTGYYNSALVIVEAESTEGLTAQHTEQQISTFFQHATKYKGFFILAVSKSDAKAAKALANRLCGNAGNVLLWQF